MLAILYTSQFPKLKIITYKIRKVIIQKKKIHVIKRKFDWFDY